jgi:hypothetical protein
VNFTEFPRVHVPVNTRSLPSVSSPIQRPSTASRVTGPQNETKRARHARRPGYQMWNLPLTWSMPSM